MNPTLSQQKVSLNIPKDLEKAFENFKVPFFYAANSKIPKIYDEIFPKESSLIRFGSLNRTANSDSIDAEFDLIQKSDDSNVKILVECKNRKEDLDASELLRIIEKGTNYQLKENVTAPFLLLFCRDTSDFQKNTKTLKKLKEIAQNPKYPINIVFSESSVVNGDIQVNLKPLLPKLSCKETAAFNVIIIPVKPLFEKFN